MTEYLLLLICGTFAWFVRYMLILPERRRREENRLYNEQHPPQRYSQYVSLPPVEETTRPRIVITPVTIQTLRAACKPQKRMSLLDAGPFADQHAHLLFQITETLCRFGASDFRNAPVIDCSKKDLRALWDALIEMQHDGVTAIFGRSMSEHLKAVKSLYEQKYQHFSSSSNRQELRTYSDGGIFIAQVTLPVRDVELTQYGRMLKGKRQAVMEEIRQHGEKGERSL